jgi:putative thioredoxin
VLVDFWAAWCGPCKVLGPILERLAQNNNAQWVLAKVDTDKHQDLAVKYGIRGIPSVKLFVDGKVSNEFTGALPEPAVVQWLRKALPNKFRKEIESVLELLKKNKATEGQSLLEHVLQNDPGNEHAKVLLAGSLVSTDAQKAMDLVAHIEEDSEHFLAADAILTFGTLMAKALQPELLPDDPVKPAYLAALSELAAFNYDAALGKFITVLRENRFYDDDGARKACIAIFRMLGDDHEITQQRRREFSSALYV